MGNRPRSDIFQFKSSQNVGKGRKCGTVKKWCDNKEISLQPFSLTVRPFHFPNSYIFYTKNVQLLVRLHIIFNYTAIHHFPFLKHQVHIYVRTWYPFFREKGIVVAALKPQAQSHLTKLWTKYWLRVVPRYYTA